MDYQQIGNSYQISHQHHQERGIYPRVPADKTQPDPNKTKQNCVLIPPAHNTTSYSKVLQRPGAEKIEGLAYSPMW